MGLHACTKAPSYQRCRQEEQLPYHAQLLCMQASLPQTVAAMRFILAYQSATTGQAQGPLTEEEFLTRLHEWVAMEPSSTGCTPDQILL